MEQAISSDLIRGHIDTIILHTLLDGDKYAQQIIDTVDVKSDKQYQLNQATLYSSLKRLENLKYVKSYWFDAQDGRRKFIKITDKGREFVDANLSNWAFSRAIIDKLMNVAPERVVPVVVSPADASREKSAEENKETAPVHIFIQKSSSDALTQNDKVETVSYTPVVNTYKNESTEKLTREEDIKEINFRNILNGLIKASAPAVHENSDKTVIEEVGSEDVVVQQKFADTIDMEFKEARARSGKIDFSDLVLAAEQEGYKIRVSSRDSARPEGVIYKNRLQLLSVLAVFAVSIVEYLLLYFRYGGVFSNFFFIAAAVIVLAVPVIFAVRYFSDPYKTLSGQISGDRILTCAIILFNLVLITFALNFLLNVNFSDRPSLVRYLFVPLLVFADVFLYFVAEFVFSNTNLVKVKNKTETAN